MPSTGVPESPGRTAVQGERRTGCLPQSEATKELRRSGQGQQKDHSFLINKACWNTSAFFMRGVGEWEGINTLIYCFTPPKAKKGVRIFKNLLTKTAFWLLISLFTVASEKLKKDRNKNKPPSTVLTQPSKMREVWTVPSRTRRC